MISYLSIKQGIREIERNFEIHIIKLTKIKNYSLKFKYSKNTFMKNIITEGVLRNLNINSYDTV